MLARLAHRGPDDRGRHLNGDVTLAHARLAIVDPSGGAQPLVDDTGASVVANCEIYNHLDLRRELPGLNSGSDAAVLLPLYHRQGPDMFGLLDGMFAVVIADGEGRLVAGRDPLGIKPLYQAHRGTDVAFASEMKALSGWEHVSTVPPGHSWTQYGVTPFYRLPEPSLDGDLEQPAIEHWSTELRRALEGAVVKRLMSDVPLGTFLSGGIDSSIVTALAARHMPGLETFALGFEGSADIEAARSVADHLGTNHHEVVVSENEPAEVLSEVLYYLESWDRDLVRSSLPTYLVARFAARAVKVVLTGEGADELFAGYRYHRDYADYPATLQKELHRSVGTMHDSNLQRVDRMTMAHSLEARVPFLDPAVVEVAMQIPAALKLRRDASGRLVEKWILRRAFEDLLPQEVVWRTKSQFDEGSGTVERLASLAASAPPEPAPELASLRDREEAWYFARLRSELDSWQTVARNTRVWSEGRIPVPA